MEFSHGLCFGRRQLTILTPQPLSFTSRLCLPSHRLTSLEMCQLALSQIRSRVFLPTLSRPSQHHERTAWLWSSRACRRRTLSTCPRAVEGRGRSRIWPWGRGRPWRPTVGSCEGARPPRRRRSKWAAPPGSTSIRPQSLLPTRGGLQPPPSVGRAAFFSFVQGIGGGDPPLGPLPAYAQKTPERGADGLPRDPLFGETLLEGGLGGHLQSPQATLIPELSRRAVEHPPQPLGRVRVEGGMHALWSRGASDERIQALLVEGADGVANRLGGAPETLGYLGRRAAAGAGEQYLAAAHHEGLPGAQPRFEAFALLFRQFPDKYWRFHKRNYSPSHTTLSEDALGWPSATNIPSDRWHRHPPKGRFWGVEILLPGRHGLARRTAAQLYCQGDPKGVRTSSPERRGTGSARASRGCISWSGSSRG